jgi:hypothetical protein
MSRSHLIDDAHRLRPEDLTDRPWRTTVANVSVQGVEAAQPVLHLAGVAKRLALNEVQCRALIDITGSAAWRDWIGTTVELRAATLGDQRVIVIRAPGQARSPRVPPTLALGPELRRWLLSAAAVAVMLAMSALYVRANWVQISSVLSALLGAP